MTGREAGVVTGKVGLVMGVEVKLETPEVELVTGEVGLVMGGEVKPVTGGEVGVVEEAGSEGSGNGASILAEAFFSNIALTRFFLFCIEHKIM